MSRAIKDRTLATKLTSVIPSRSLLTRFENLGRSGQIVKKAMECKQFSARFSADSLHENRFTLKKISSVDKDMDNINDSVCDFITAALSTC